MTHITKFLTSEVTERMLVAYYQKEIPELALFTYFSGVFNHDDDQTLVEEAQEVISDGFEATSPHSFLTWLFTVEGLDLTNYEISKINHSYNKILNQVS